MNFINISKGMSRKTQNSSKCIGGATAFYTKIEILLKNHRKNVFSQVFTDFPNKHIEKKTKKKTAVARNPGQ